MTPATARILLATNGSPTARHATEVAAELASAFNAELTVVHVVPAIEYRVGRLAPMLPITRRLDDPYASAVLLDARRIAWDNGAAARTVLIAGEAPQAIVALATRLQAALVVIGAKQRRRRPRLLALMQRCVQAHAARSLRFRQASVKTRTPRPPASRRCRHRCPSLRRSAAATRRAAVRAGVAFSSSTEACEP
jgi:nucleotide-binding universal stress UspA family protein